MPSPGGRAFAEAVAAISEKLGWPVLADVLNPLRGQGGALPRLVSHYDTFLRSADQASALRPDAVLQIGPLPTSKCLRGWLKDIGAVHFLLNERPVNTDPLHRVAVPLLGTAGALADALEKVNVVQEGEEDEEDLT